MREIWRSIDNDSEMFDFHAFYDMIATTIPDKATLVEAGISNGRSIICLAESLLNEGKSFRLIGIDDLSYGGHTQLNAIISNIGKAGLGEYIEIMTMDSLSASCTFPDGSIDFVFLDSSHKYEITKSEIRCWIPKIKDGGILAGHDYFGIEEVRNAVDEVLQSYSVKKEQTDHGSGVWIVEKVHKMLNEDSKFVIDRELRKMITKANGMIASAPSETQDGLFSLSDKCNAVLEEFNNPQILV